MSARLYQRPSGHCHPHLRGCGFLDIIKPFATQALIAAKQKAMEEAKKKAEELLKTGAEKLAEKAVGKVGDAVKERIQGSGRPLIEKPVSLEVQHKLQDKGSVGNLLALQTFDRPLEGRGRSREVELFAKPPKTAKKLPPKSKRQPRVAHSLEALAELQ